ncbi:MAG: hypothetical protein FGM16_05885 [Flavobacterium sp.]|nr:hypothetical protein [Flavobacterium sp.]
MNKSILVLVFSMFSSAYAQQDVNSYRYLLMPEKFSFLKQKDQYNLNSLVKIHFEKLGFVVFYDSETLPDSLVNYNCNKLFADIESTGNFLTTKLVITLKDCKNNVVVRSKEGKSKEKDFKISYSQAFRDAFTTFRELRYQYQPNSTQAVIETSKTSLPNHAGVEMVYAQPTTNGFQLVDSTPKVVYKLVATSNPVCFIAFKGELQGVLVQKNEAWFFEYYTNGQLNSEQLMVKF